MITMYFVLMAWLSLSLVAAVVWHYFKIGAGRFDDGPQSTPSTSIFRR